MSKINVYKVLVGSKNLNEPSRLFRVFAENEGDAAAQANRNVHYGAGNIIESIICEQRGAYAR